VGLRLSFEDREVIIPDGTTAVVGSDPDATIRVAKPGISRRHVVVKNEGKAWVVQDTSSRNGTYHDGARIQSLDVGSAMTIRLGHPATGPEVALEPTGDAPTVTPAASSIEPTRVVTPPVTHTPAPAPVRPNASANAELEALIATLNDTVKSIRGLTWSVWAMIAVTAVLAVLTLFVGVIGS